jgi:hypothetical protein
MTELDMLKNFRNQHLEKYISSKIFTKYYNEMCMPDDVVIKRVVPSGQAGLPNSVIEKNIKAKELGLREAQVFDQERKFLVVIDKLIEEVQKNG